MRSILNTHPGMYVANILEPALPSTESGTFYTGFIFASYDTLCRLFTAEPVKYSIGSKVNCRFVGTVDNICITVYDWKSNDDYKKRNLWHVGSHGLEKSYEVLNKIAEVADLHISFNKERNYD